MTQQQLFRDVAQLQGSSRNSQLLALERVALGSIFMQSSLFSTVSHVCLVIPIPGGSVSSSLPLSGPGSDPSPPSHPTKVIPTNRFPMDPLETLVASMDGIFAISPGGTRPDCFRHYEYLLAGNIVFLPGSPSLRRVFSGLPVVFMEDGPKAWGKLTCNVLAGHATEVAKRLKRARESGGIPPYQFEKLTLDYWKFFLMDRIEDVWTAASTKDKGQLDSRGPGS